MESNELHPEMHAEDEYRPASDAGQQVESSAEGQIAAAVVQRPMVAGIGASAGGLGALKDFFSHVPVSSGLAFVVVVHLSPEHESHLADLLQVRLSIPVEQVTGTTQIEPDHVYVIPPGHDLSAIDSHLHLSKQEKRREARTPIDHFFRTLAASHDSKAIGIILSGTGSDGSQGVKDIKERGGLVIVQDPHEAEFDGMPQSAITTGLVDLVLPLHEIPQAIIRYTRTKPRVVVAPENEDVHAEERLLLQKILAQVRARTGRDFSRYKRSTIMRRIGHRMQLRNVEEVSEYLQILLEQPEEVRSLADEFLITVTHFFRDSEVFDKLTSVISGIFDGKQLDEHIRVWSIGCATGEEPYSLAMLLLEEAGRRAFAPQLHVFASDLHEPSLRRAREGLYHEDIEADVSPERLRRFFTRESGGYRIRKEVRDLVIFTPHNLLADPPFSKIDLVACRNVMIYLDRSVQAEIADLFHYALNPNGLLLLGTSESIGRNDLFRVEDKKTCLYRKLNVRIPEPNLPVFPVARSLLRTEQKSVAPAPTALSYNDLHLKLLQQIAPPSLLLNQDYRVVHLSDGVGRYLRLVGGEITNSVFKLIREELRIELCSALHVARESGKVVRTRPIYLPDESHLIVVQVEQAREYPGFYLVLFEEHEKPAAAAEDGVTSGLGSTSREMEAELEITKNRLQTLIEEYETSQEESRATLEELQSANEELRSTMEELETSKEELQSMNEELQTLNQENRHKVEELGLLSSDLQNLLTSSEIATLFLDRTLRIMRFTPRVGELFNVRMADRGRPLSDLTHKLGYSGLLDDARQVLERLIPIEREIQDEPGRWYLMRVVPYRTAEDYIEGVVITFVDITVLKEAGYALRESEDRFNAMADLVPDLLWRCDARGNTTWFSRRWIEYTGQTPAMAEGSGWMETFHPDDKERSLSALQAAIDDGRPMSQESRIRSKDGAYRWFLVRAEPVQDVQGQVQHWFGVATDIHEQRTHLELLEERVQAGTHQVKELARRLTMAEQEERRRVSQILHDDLQQMLYGISMKIGKVRKNLADLGQQALVNDMDTLSAWIEMAVTTTRQLTVDLSPPVLQSEGLADALAWLQRQMEELHGLEISLEAEHAFFIADEDLRVLLFQIVRELLFNVKKHAGVNRAKVQLVEEAGHLVIRVSDDGRGFDVEKKESHWEHENGFGLFSVRERLALLGGHLDIQSRLGSGTYIEVHAPIP